MAFCRKNANVDGTPQFVQASDWTGEDDPGNPHNWPLRRKLYSTAVPTSFAFICTFSPSVYTPARSEVEAEFQISSEVSLLPFIFFLLGLAFGPIISAPSSETFGRKIVYLGSLPLFAAFTLGAGFSQNIISLTVCRFFAGLFSSPGLSIGTGTVSDIWPPYNRSIPMTLYVAVSQIGPVLGPLVGGYVSVQKGWRWTQWVILFACTGILALALPMNETYKKVILQKRAKKYNIPGPPQPERTHMETAKLFVTRTLERPLTMLVSETIVGLFSGYVAFNFGLLNSFFAAFPYVFDLQYNFDTESTGLTFIAQAIGSVMGVVIIEILNKYQYKPRLLAAKQNHTKVLPEQRLPIAMVGGPLLPISLFWFAWTAQTSVHWIVPVIAEVLFGCGNQLVFIAASLYITDCYGAAYGASAWSANTFARYIAGTVFPLFTIQMYENLGTEWASSLLAFISVVLVPIPYAFFVWGSRLRRKSKYPPE